MATNGRDALEIFPAEIWELILEELRKHGSSQDVLNCSKVCKEFERILEPTKHDWLFESICPFLFPYMKGGELLACRKICKNWRRGVDNFLADFETRRPFDEGTSDLSHSSEYDPLKKKRVKWRKIRGEAVLIKFLEAMKNKEMATPFVGRSLFLKECIFSRDTTGTKFFERALEMLSLYGDQIWHLRLQPKEPCTFYSDQFHQILKQMLGNTPHLKSLTLDSNGDPYTTYKDDKSGVKEPLDHPLEISSLESLEVSILSGLPILILEKLMKKINLGNLKCLKLHHPHSYNGQPSAVQPFQHLTELHVSSPQWEDVEHIFNNMISPTAPLAKLSLMLGSKSEEFDFDRASNLFSRWKGSLRMLFIKGYMRSNYGEPPISLSKLDAPNLKSLGLDGIVFGIGLLNPILTASLEYLHIRYDGTIFDEETEFYKCVFQEGELHNSSIWGEMKKLKVIRVHFPHYTRFRRNGTENVACTREMHERGIRPEVFVIKCPIRMTEFV